jgi:ubiquinone/menaquinone biosynthesis C-methylase UbiE
VSYDPRRGRGFAAEVERLEAQAALGWPEEARLLRELVPTPAAVLDVGCGSGAALARLAGLYPDASVVGAEPDPELAAVARERGDVVEASAERLPFPDGTFDLVLARYVFQHLPDPVAAARELRRVLRPGGTLAAVEVDGQLWGIAEPSFPETAPIHAKLWAAQRGRGGDRTIGRRLPRVLAAAGFEDVALRLYGSSSAEHGLDAFAVHLDPAGFAERDAITDAEYARLVDAYERFRADPSAYVVLAGLVVAGRVPSRNSPTVDSS